MTTQPGWYADPSGAPDALRWWDGHAWTNQVRPASGPGAPSAPPGSPPRPRRPWWPWLAAAVALVLAVALLAWHPWSRGTDDEAGDDPTSTVTGWDEQHRSTPPTAEASEDGQGSPTQCPMTLDYGHTEIGADGRIHGGGLSFAAIPDWSIDNGATITWGHGAVGQQRIVAPSWVAIVALAELRAEDGWKDAKSAARQAAECMASSDYYPDRTGYKVLWNKPYTLDGHRGWWVRGEVRVDGHSVDGDVIDTIVVDFGNGVYGTCATQAAIGQADTQKTVDDAVASLRVG